jgi:hypothetical protein
VAILHDIIVVKVSIKFSSTLGDISVARNADTAEDLWLDLANSTVLPYEFGGTLYYYARVSNLALTRNSVTRPAVVLVAFHSHTSPVVPTQIEVAQTSATNAICYLLDSADARIKTYGTLYDGEDQIFRYQGMYNAAVGWKLRLPTPLVWDKSNLAILKRVPSGYSDPSSGNLEYLGGPSTLCDITELNSWLATNLPEYGTTLSIYGYAMFQPYDYVSGWHIYVNHTGLQFKLRISSSGGNNMTYSISAVDSSGRYARRVETGGPSCGGGNVNAGDNICDVTTSTTSLGGIGLSGKPLTGVYSDGTTGNLPPAASLTGTARFGSASNNIYSTLTFTLGVTNGRYSSLSLTGTCAWSALDVIDGYAIVQGAGGSKV